MKLTRPSSKRRNVDQEGEKPQILQNAPTPIGVIMPKAFVANVIISSEGALLPPNVFIRTKEIMLVIFVCHATIEKNTSN